MPPVASGAASGQKWKLLQEAIDDAELSVRKLARAWAGPGADNVQVESARSQVNRWLNQGKRPTRRNALKLARLLGKPKDYFVTDQSRQRVTVALLAERVEALAGDVEELRAEILRGRGQGRQ